MSRVRDIDHGIKHLDADDVCESVLAAAVIAVRFQPLATTEWLIADRFPRGEIMRKNVIMWAEHALVHGEVHVATSAPLPHGGVLITGAPQAAAIWLRCDQQGTSPPLPQRYWERLGEDCGRYAGNFRELSELFAKHRPLDRGPYESLEFLASMQDGYGQGTALLCHNLQLLDRRGLGAYVVAADERSCRLYERHGFERLDPALRLPRSDHVMFPMWRWPSAVEARRDSRRSASPSAPPPAARGTGMCSVDASPAPRLASAADGARTGTVPEPGCDLRSRSAAPRPALGAAPPVTGYIGLIP